LAGTLTYAATTLQVCIASAPHLSVIDYFSGIAAAGYHRVNYFKGVDARERHDNFFEKVLKVKDLSVLTFADLVQRLLVDYIRDVLLQPEAAEWLDRKSTRLNSSHDP
jgi:hypothetical protein